MRFLSVSVGWSPIPPALGAAEQVTVGSLSGYFTCHAHVVESFDVVGLVVAADLSIVQHE